jgi:hypothetical protein
LDKLNFKDMEPTQEQLTPDMSNDKINDVVALNQLVNIIVDYYSFKNKLNEDEEGDKWKKDIPGGESDFVVPGKLDTIIEKAFTTQLKKFT